MTTNTRTLIGTGLMQAAVTLVIAGCGGAFDGLVDPLTGSGIRHELSVKLDGDGSVDTLPAGPTLDSGTEVVLVATPSDGSRFVGWALEGEDLLEGAASNELTIILDADLTVTAVFVAQHDLTIEVVGEGHIEPSDGRFDEADVVVLTAIPADGFRFVGWGLADNAPLEDATSPELTLTMNDDKAVTAVFVAQYGLTTTVAGEGTVEPAGGTFDDGTEVRMTATAHDGFVFDRWDGDVPSDSEMLNPLTIVMNQETSLTAVFAPQHDLIINVSGNGAVYPNGGTFTEGTSLTITAFPDDGFVFDGWIGDAAGNENPLVLSVNRDMAITAVFMPIPMLTVTVQGQGTVDPSGGWYEHGTRITIVAIASPGHVFVRWVGDAPAGAAETNPLELEFDRDKNLTAVFVQGIRPGAGLGCIDLGDTADRVVQCVGGLYETAPNPEFWINYLAYENLGIAAGIEDVNRNWRVDDFEPVLFIFATQPFSGTYDGLGIGSTWDDVAQVMGSAEAINSPYYLYCAQGIQWTVMGGTVNEVSVFDPFSCKGTTSKTISSVSTGYSMTQQMVSGARAALKKSR